MHEGRPVKHPLIDRVRECSATPDAAANFFCLLFQFKPERHRLHDAACHAYLRATFDRMKAAPAMSITSSLDMMEGEKFSPFMSCSLHDAIFTYFCLFGHQDTIFA